MAIVGYVEVLRGKSVPARDFDRIGRAMAFFTLGMLFLFAVKIVSALYGSPPEKAPAMLALLGGSLSVNFWIFEVCLGILVPLALLAGLVARTPQLVALAGISSLIGAFFMRYDLVIAGQLVPMREDLAEPVSHLLSYVPSASEIGIVAGSIALSLLLYTLAEKFLPQERRKD